MARQTYLGYVARVLVVVTTVAALTGGASAARGAEANQPPVRSLVCKLPGEAKKLPATSRHGLIDHLLQYPAVHLATRKERARARTILVELVTASEHGRWNNVHAARRAGYETRTAPRRAGDLSVHYFHAERPQEPRAGRSSTSADPRRCSTRTRPGVPSFS